MTKVCKDCGTENENDAERCVADGSLFVPRNYNGYTNKKTGYDYMKDNIFQDIYRNDRVKDALMLLLASDTPLKILIVGDPCSGKTLLINRVAEASNSKVIKSFSDLKDDESKIICLDDFDISFLKDDKYYRDIFDIGKSVLMTMRPEFGRIDPYQIITEQITLPKRMLNEFDLIFFMKDEPTSEKDKEVVSNFLNNKTHKIDKTIINYINSLENDKKLLNDEAKQELSTYYVKMRNIDENKKERGPIPITLRTIETIIKLSEIYAKYNKTQEISKKEARKAIEIMHYTISQICLDPETGWLDIHKLEL